MIPRGSWLLVFAALACALGIGAVPALAASHDRVPVPRSVTAADLLVTGSGRSAERLAAFRAWAREATLDELMYVLRHTSAVLGDLETPAAQAALDRAPAGRAELRERLAARVSVPAPKRSRRANAAAPGAGEGPAPHSTFRVALLLPSRGDHAAEAADLEAGFRAGLASRAAAGRPPIECVIARTGGEDPAEVAAAFDSVSRGVALVCGGFTRASAALLGAASRWSGLPVLLPVVDDAAAARLSARAWSIGPAAEDRGRTLAESMRIEAGDRVAVIASAASDTAFAGGFIAGCNEHGVTFVSRSSYAPGNTSFAADVRALAVQRVTVLFWDGDAGEAAALLRQLTRERVSLRICGGEGFDPGRHHRETRVFLEGVMYVPEDWALSAEADTALTRALPARDQPGEEPSSALSVRGWLAGRMAGTALAAAPYTPDELAAAIAKLGPGAADSMRLLGVRAAGAELPVFTVGAGHAVRAR